jgi:hypothetical protein
MEDILEVYCLPYDPQIPQVCMDEQSRQLIQETRTPLAAEPGLALRGRITNMSATARRISLCLQSR